jgi:predicted RNA-binding Zn-ribbon protein involved in translation (DUF1610 family)
MKTKKTFSFNEEKEAKDIIENGFDVKGIDYGKMYIVAKYFRQKEGLGKLRLKRKLIEFCKLHDETFNPVIEKDALRNWINSALKYNLRYVDSVNISRKDVEFLKKIERERDRKLLFMTLIFAKGLKKGNTKRGKTNYKTSPHLYIKYHNFKDIIRLSELTNISETNFAEILHSYKEHFTFYNAERELIRLDFADKEMEDIIVVNDLEHPLKNYNDIFGKRLSYCDNCGIEIHKKSNSQLYCKSCSEEIRREQWRVAKRKERKGQ